MVAKVSWYGGEGEGAGDLSKGIGDGLTAGVGAAESSVG